MARRFDFKGKDQVINAYELNGVGPWAIFSGREIMFQSTDRDVNTSADMLDKVLTQMIEAGGSGDYRLRIYDELPTGKKINSSTPANYGFNFMLLSDEEFERTTGRTLGSGSQIGQVLDRLAAIEARFQESEDQEIPEPESKMQQAIGAIIQRPDVQNFLLQKVFGLVNGITNYFTPKQPPAAMAGFQPDGMNETQKTVQELFQALPQDEQMKFDQAVSILLRGDPSVGTNLMKLANILVNDPGKYQMLTKMA